MISYDTVTAAVAGLRQRGYTIDFNLSKDYISSQDHRLEPEEFEITEVYRFEGNSDPADEAVVYAIDGNKGEKGILVNGYGPSADPMTEKMAKKLSIHRL